MLRTQVLSRQRVLLRQALAYVDDPALRRYFDELLARNELLSEERIVALEHAVRQATRTVLADKKGWTRALVNARTYKQED